MPRRRCFKKRRELAALAAAGLAGFGRAMSLASHPDAA
jgi:hypothetical protein